MTYVCIDMNNRRKANIDLLMKDKLGWETDVTPKETKFGHHRCLTSDFTVFTSHLKYIYPLQMMSSSSNAC